MTKKRILLIFEYTLLAFIVFAFFFFLLRSYGVPKGAYPVSPEISFRYNTHEPVQKTIPWIETCLSDKNFTGGHYCVTMNLDVPPAIIKTDRDFLLVLPISAATASAYQ